MFIKPTKDASGSLFDVHEEADELLLYPANEDVACPWDADIYVEGGKVILVGSLLPGGARGGSCRCECSVDDFTKFYKLEAPDVSDDLLNALYNAGWVRSI